MRFFIFIYSLLFFYGLKIYNFIFSISAVCLLILTIIVLSILNSHSIKKTQKAVSILQKDINAKLYPCVNVNKVGWQVFNQLPGFSRVKAKKVVWIRNHNGRYVSKNDFYLKNDVSEEEQLLLDKIIHV